MDARLREIASSLQAACAKFDPLAADAAGLALREELGRRIRETIGEIATEVVKGDEDPDVETSTRLVEAISEAIVDVRKWWSERLEEPEEAE